MIRPEPPARSVSSLHIVAAALLLLATGVADGLQTGRWSPRTDADADLLLVRLPARVADWESSPGLTPEHPRTVEVVCRTYQHAVTGRTVRMLAVSGLSEDVAAWDAIRVLTGPAWRPMARAGTLTVLEPDPGGAADRVHTLQVEDHYQPASLQTRQRILASAWTDRELLLSASGPPDSTGRGRHVYQIVLVQDWDFSSQSRPRDVHNFLSDLLPHWREQLHEATAWEVAP